MRLPGGAAALPTIAVDAARDHVFPRALATERARDHVVEVQLGALRLHAAVLALEVVAGHQVDAAEAHVSARQAVERHQHDHARDADAAVRRADRLVVARHGELRPALEVEGLVLLVDDARDALINERESAPRRRDVDRQIRTIQDEYVRAQHRPAHSK